MRYEWGISDNFSGTSKMHALNDNDLPLCMSEYRLKYHPFKIHAFHRYSGDDFPPFACKRCLKLFVAAVKNDCIEIRKEKLRLGEIER